MNTKSVNEESQGTNVTHRFASFMAQGFAFADLPCDATTRLQQCLLDFIGVTAFAAVASESSNAIRNGVSRLVSANGEATVLGEKDGYPYASAALLNGAFAHSLDFDDTNIYGSGHPGAPIIPVALAMAERVDASGEELLTALAAGYETFCRVGAALGQTSYDRGFHITSIAGIYGAIAAGARLLKMSPDDLANAWGLGGSMASGSMQYLENGAWNKRLHPGKAAHDAILCLVFTETGVIGAKDALGGRFGTLAGYSNSPMPELLLQNVGTRWELTDTAIKPYPSCRFTHGAIDVALDMRHKIGANVTEDGRLSLQISPRAFQIVGGVERHKMVPGNVVDAQFSVYFQTAVALLDGTVSWSSYERLADPEVLALTSRLKVESDASLSSAGAVLRWTSCDGESTIIRREYPRGEPLGEALPWELIETKFDDLAGALFNERQRQAIAAAVHRLPKLCSTAEWILTLRDINSVKKLGTP